MISIVKAYFACNHAAMKRLPATWAKTARMKHFEDLLFWLGEAGRRDLMDHFNITASVASDDISNYELLCRDHDVRNFDYDRKKKKFFRAEAMRRLLADARDDALLIERANEVDGIDDGFLDVVSLPARRSDTQVLQTVIRAILDAAVLTFDYVSEDGVERRRMVVPTRLVRFSTRWHFRGWCLDRNDWRDFVIGRIHSIQVPESTEPYEGFVPYDEDWDKAVSVILTVNPSLPEKRRKIISEEYGADANGEIAIKTRSCFRFYYQRTFVPALKPEESPIIYSRAEK